MKRMSNLSRDTTATMRREEIEKMNNNKKVKWQMRIKLPDYINAKRKSSRIKVYNNDEDKKIRREKEIIIIGQFLFNHSFSVVF